MNGWIDENRPEFVQYRRQHTEQLGTHLPDTESLQYKAEHSNCVTCSFTNSRHQSRYIHIILKINSIEVIHVLSIKTKIAATSFAKSVIIFIVCYDQHTAPICTQVPIVRETLNISRMRRKNNLIKSFVKVFASFN